MSFATFQTYVQNALRYAPKFNIVASSWHRLRYYWRRLYHQLSVSYPAKLHTPALGAMSHFYFDGIMLCHHFDSLIFDARVLLSSSRPPAARQHGIFFVGRGRSFPLFTGPCRRFRLRRRTLSTNIS